MRKPPTSYHIMNAKANHDTNAFNNGLLYVITFFEGGLGQNDYSMGTIHRRKCTHCRLEITSTMPRCFLVTSTMSRHIQKNETRNKNRSFHMKRKKKSFIKTRKKNRSSHLGKKSLIPSTNPETTRMERESCLAMTQESIHALGARIHNHDLGLSVYPIAKLSELMLYCLLPSEG